MRRASADSDSVPFEMILMDVEDRTYVCIKMLDTLAFRWAFS